MTAAEPAVIRVGQARVTAGLDRYARLDLAAHRAVFGTLPDLDAADLIAMCEQVDLRGRGGAGFPVASKLRAVRERAGKRCAIVVNGTEGEPASAKDKTLLARSPHLVLDGALAAARALQAREIVVAVAGDGDHVRSVATAVAADAALSRLVRVVSVPDRYVSGESGALISAINGGPALPPGNHARASEAGVRGMPTLLSNAETFAQLAVLARLGPAEYASAGSAGEPGTVLLTVGGSVTRPAVVETESGVLLGHILALCGAREPSGVLVGGYHGMWLAPNVACRVPVSRTGISASGGTLGAGVVLVLGQDTCPIGEVARIAGYLAGQSAGQCGPCKLGLPALARSLSVIAAGGGGIDELESVRRTAAGVRGRGACHHPDGTANFVASALDVFAGDLSEHMFRGTCGRPVLGVLPLSGTASETRLAVDWTRCRGHGLCARLVPELIQLDEHGYPAFLDAPVPFWLSRDVHQAVSMCPALALSLNEAGPAALKSWRKRGRAAPPALPSPASAPLALPSSALPSSALPSPALPSPALPSPARPSPAQLPPTAGVDDDEPPTLTGRALRKADLAAASEWLSVLGGHGWSGDI